MKTAAGSALVLICSFFLSKCFTDEQRKKVVHLKAVIDIITRIREQMNMSLATLPEIYGGIDFLKSETEFIKHLLMEKGFYATVKLLCLSKESRAAAEEFAFSLGRLDGATQKQKADSTLTRLNEIYTKEKEEYTKKSKSITALFCLFGAIAVILAV